MTERRFTVRQAQALDIPRLVELEQIKFGGQGTEVYDDSYFRCWLGVHPEGLLVSCTADGTVVGYSYTQCVDFDFDHISRLTTYNDFTDGGYTAKTHRGGGNTIHGVTAVAVMEGAVHTIVKVTECRMVRDHKKYHISGARIPGFDSYLKELESRNVDMSPFADHQIAEWYVACCVRDFGGFLWPSFPTVDLDLPAPQQPDKVLNKWMRHEGFGVAAVLPNWMQDPKSREFGALILMKNPNLK